ncbi:MAG: serpin family protein [Bacteroidota bacterium]
MQRIAWLLVLALSLVALALTGCDLAGTDPPTDPVPIELDATGKALVEQSAAFGTGLFAQVAADEEDDVMLSPLSASVALTMLLNGADGETYAQIHEMLGYAPEQDLDAVNAAYRSLREQLLAADPSVQLALANAIFYDEAFDAASPFKAPFLAAMRGPFDATVEGLDFAAPASVDVVNGWAADNTNDRIPTVLDELDPDLVMLLMNALTFKGDWTAPFDADLTADAPFRLGDGTTTDVPTMNGKLPARLVAGDGYQALELTYGRQNFSMVVFLPEADLPAFAGLLDAGLWTDATTRLDAIEAPSDVEVRLPRFTFSFERTLNDDLQALGMVDAFDGRADLSRLNDDPRLQVSFVKQNTFVDVGEEGTEAAAVTTIGVERTSLGPSFVADRPFVFAVRERTTNTLLFIGQVTDPS